MVETTVGDAWEPQHEGARCSSAERTLDQGAAVGSDQPLHHGAAGTRTASEVLGDVVPSFPLDDSATAPAGRPSAPSVISIST